MSRVGSAEDQEGPVRLLWTGGWDSTFRLLDLLLVQGRAVQPVYLISSGRASTMQEIRTMEALRTGILARLADPSLLRPTEVHLWSDYPATAELREAFEAVRSKERIGIQYLHMAAVGQALGWHGVETGVVAADRWGARTGGPGSSLFRCFSFPLLDVSKERMGELARENGFYDLLVQRWFCQTPFAGRPCGVCRPCRTAPRDHVDFAHPVPVYLRRAWRDPRARRLLRRPASPRPGSGEARSHDVAPLPDTRLRALARRAVPGQLLTVRRVVRAWRGFLQAEWESPLRLAAPSLVVRGFLSERRWQYPSTPSRSRGYLSDAQYRRVVEKFNPLWVQRVFNDKAGFASVLAEHGLGDRTPRQLATVVDGVVAGDVPAWAGPVVRKPVDGQGGQGVAALATLEEALATCPPMGTFIVQERVVGHPYAVELYPGSLNTLRVITIRDEPGGEPRVAVAVQRIGREGTGPLDSFSAGGMAAAVDLSTGRLGPAVARVLRRERVTYDHHPDTGAAITGLVVPLLADTLDLVLQAMRVVPDALHIGWDVAVSDRGPLIIEGNARMPAIRVVQAQGPFALDPACRDFYQRWGLLPARAPRPTAGHPA